MPTYPPARRLQSARSRPMKRVGSRLLLRLRSYVLARVPAGTLRRRSRPSLPTPSQPDPDHLLVFPGDRELPEKIRDDWILRRALEWQRAGGSPKPEPQATSAQALKRRRSRPVTNVIFVSHCDFVGNSAYHVHAIASELQRRGLSPAVAIPGGAYTVEEVGQPDFPLLTYKQVRRGRLRFPDGRGPDLIHAFTPRERVRRLTVDLIRAYECPYVVHLEDNDEVLLSTALGGADVDWLRSLPASLLDGVIEQWQSHPQLAPQFLDHAVGATLVIDGLLELVPPHVPAEVIRAGFDEAVISPRRTRDAVRNDLRLAGDDLAIVYPGHIHAANLEEVRGLWQAVANLRADESRVVLVKTGWSAAEVAGFPDLGDGLRDLGWVPRSRIAELLAAADVLVQPGGPGPFNDYRLPSKLPEFLASGTPVVLPRTNVGLLLEDGVHALVLERGDCDEIADAINRLAGDPALRQRLGDEGRAFALRELSWGRAVGRVERLYARIAASGHPAPPPSAIASPEPPLKLVALVDRTPAPTDIRAARAHGIYGFCLTSLPAELPDAPFCVVLPDGLEEANDVKRLVRHREYLHFRGAPVVLRPEDPALERLSRLDSPGAYRHTMEERLAAVGPMLPPYRSLPRPPEDALDVYETWLRKLTLQAILLGPARAPLVLLDLTAAHSPSFSRLLERTLAGLSAGVVQAYASRRIALSRRDAEHLFRLP